MKILSPLEPEITMERVVMRMMECSLCNSGFNRLVLAHDKERELLPKMRNISER